MFGSQTLDVAIGLIFVYLLLSLACSALREVAEQWFKSRARFLERGIRELMDAGSPAKLPDPPPGTPNASPSSVPDGEALVKMLYDHPLLNALYEGRYEPLAERSALTRWLGSTNLPTYIPTRSFAVALLDVAARGDARGGARERLSIDRLRDVSATIGEPRVRRAIDTAVDLAGPAADLAQVQAHVQAWYDTAMDRVSGRYKRRTQAWLLALGLVAAVALNVDTVTIARYLYHNEGARATVIASATGAVRDSSIMNEKLTGLLARIDALGLPIGWPEGFGRLRSPEPSPRAAGATRPTTALTAGTDWSQAMLGWLLTALAVSLGAPFWFDLLNKVMIVRSTVKPHEKSPEEASDDRQLGGATKKPTTTTSTAAEAVTTTKTGIPNPAELAAQLPDHPAIPVP